MPIVITPITRRHLAAALGSVVVLGVALWAVTSWLDRRDDHQLRFLQGHPLASAALTDATLMRAANSDRSARFDVRPATVVRIWLRSSVRDVLLALDTHAGTPPLIRGLSRCLIVPDSDRGHAVFTWRPEPGSSAVELYGVYYDQPPSIPC